MDDSIDICMPTYESGEVVEGTLERLKTALDATETGLGQLIVVDNESDDGTKDQIERFAKKHDWNLVLRSEPSRLPEARELAIKLVQNDWFLFLDDDVRLTESYLTTILEWRACDRVGAVQGRKDTRTEHPADWVRRRARRGGTHATLIRTRAVRGVSIPEDIEVLEDEFLRRVVETQNYRWVLDPMAEFSHATQNRHPIGWAEGYVGGKYGLSQGHTLALNVPFALLTGRNPLPHLKRCAGWVAGRFSRNETANTKITRQNQSDMMSTTEDSL